MMPSALSGNSCGIFASASCSRSRLTMGKWRPRKRLSYHKLRTYKEEAEDGNTEEGYPDKEDSLDTSMGRVATDNTVGTFRPRNRGWTGYVEKDTAGQTNIYSVEPAVYVAESAISSGTAGSSAEGSSSTVAIVSSIALISIAAASAVLLQVGKSPPVVQTTQYSGPSLSYYINKFKPPEVIEAAARPSVAESSTTETSVPRVELQEVVSPLAPTPY